MKSSPSTGLTKSRFLSGRQCLKRLALEVFHPEQADEADAGRAALFLAGDRVGVVARLRHPGGVLIASSDRDEALAQTREAMANPDVPAIFEGAFQAEGLFVRADILLRQEEGWSLQEVKSSTRVKEVHLWDLAVQVLAIEDSGTPLLQAGILHLNSEYVRTDTQDLEALYLLEDRLPQVRGLLDTARAELREQASILASAEVPEVPTGTHCDEPWPCPFYKTCHPAPSATHVSFLPRSRQLVRKLAQQDVHDMRDIPWDFRLGRLQKRARDCILKKRDFVSAELQDLLETVEAPLYFMDFEAFSPALPRYRNTRCYQAIPTQWSLHILEDGVLEHREFLYAGEEDPRREFATTLLAALGTTGNILVYSSYEKTQLLKLVEAWPDLHDDIHAVIPRLQDLFVVIKNHYYHPNFLGSFSIKKVLPALVPDLTYEDLEIRDGGSAAARFEDLLDPETSADKAAGIREALLRYCERDTLAMVEIRRALIQRCGQAQSVRP